jgi:hypothetical protein
MKLSLADIPALDGPRPANAERARRHRFGIKVSMNRRGLLKTAVASGIGLGVAAVGLFPPARSARAEGRDIYDACPDYAAGHNCAPGCGPSLPCNDCCAWPSSCGCVCAAWFKNDGTTYKNRPNQCVSGTGWDGWNWYYGATCGCCRTIKYRCHDGYKKISGSWSNRICRSTIVCGGCAC